MKKMKVVLSWLLALVMMTTLLTGFQTASAATLKDLGIQLDDTSVTAVSSGTNAFTVKIPDGRPRIPQVTCAGAEITQAFIADNQTQGTAKVVKGGETYTITFVKDASLGFVLQYDDHYTWNSGLSGTVTYTSSNSSIASVSNSGEIVVKAVSNSGATITASNGSSSKKLVITKTIKAVLGVWLLTGQSNTSYHYNNYGGKGVTNKAGTAYYSGALTSGNPGSIKTKMTALNGVNTGGLEPAMASTFYNKTGEKVFIMSAGISGTGIAQFLPGSTTDFTDGSGTWKLINTVYENAVAEWATADFQSKYETRMRSFFYLQGCAEFKLHWSAHYNGFAVTKNDKEFTTAGKKYPTNSHTFLSYMTEVIGFDACLDLMVAWRPVGIITSARTAQFKLAEDFDNYEIASRLVQTMSEEEGTYRGDRLHINQIGKNILGEHAGGYAARYYNGGNLVEAATGATAYFNKIGYKNGGIIYVQPGDFYNYCTRPTNLSSDDQFAYKFTGAGADMIDFDGKNDFIVKKNAVPGTTAQMEIYSEGHPSTPITTLTVQIVGERAEDFTPVNSQTYEWTFDENKNPTTVKGDITLKAASGFGDKKVLELSRDLMLDSDGYWSIEWKSDGVGNNSMLTSSSHDYSKGALGDMHPNFINFLYDNTYGWQTYRASGFTDYFWRGQTGSPITGTHTFKLECRNNVYTFSMDGEMLDSREIVEGHGSNALNTTNPSAASHNLGKFDNVFNIHYLLGGTNYNGNSGTKYGYDGKVEYVKINIGDEKPEIARVNNYPYKAASGNGTQENPYIINANVAKDTVINESSFLVTAPAGTVAFSAEKFGGKALTSLTCDAGTKSVYVMILGSLPSMSTFYQVNLTVSDTPDVMYYEVMADASVSSLADGAKKSYTIGGKTLEFIKGKSLFTTIGEAARLVAEDGVVHVAAGTYSENVQINRDIVIKGAQAGIDPNAKGADETTAWTATRTDTSKETILTGDWTIKDGSTHFELDGVTISGGATIVDSRKINEINTDFYLKNIIVNALTTDKAMTFGEASATQVGAIKGKLYVTNMRAQGLSKAILFNTTLNHVEFNNSYFESGSKLDAFRVPGVSGDSTDNSASYYVNNCMFNGATRTGVLQFNLAPSYSKNIQAYSNVDIKLESNVFLNTICSSASLENGVIQVSADADVFNLTFKNNLVYEGSGSRASASTAFIFGAGTTTSAAEAGDYATSYTINHNRFITAESGKLPAIFSSYKGSKGHSNINVSGNYSQNVSTAVAPVTNEEINTVTEKSISYSDYHYLDAELSNSTCSHAETVVDRKEPTCLEAGYENTICSVCKDIIVENILPKTDHIASDWEITKPATCTETGTRIKTCITCSITMASEIVSATGHDEGKWRVMQDATCTDLGVRSRLCTACKTVLETESITKTEHAYQIVNTVESTCAALGHHELECITCHQKKNEIIQLKLHTPGTWEVRRPANCSVEGESVIRCTECKQILSSKIIPITHTFEWVEIIPAEDMGYGVEAYKCTVCGYEQDQRLIEPKYAQAVNKFEDIGTNDWFVKNGAVDFVYSLGLFEGTSKTTFSPNAAMTRAMFVTVLGRLSGLDANNNIDTRFSDVKKGMWYTGYVAWAADNKIVDGTSYFTFAPDAPITREQICKIIVNYCDFDPFFELKSVEKSTKFADDAKISSWAKEYIKTCQMADVINGKSGNVFDPQGQATRAEVATILRNLFMANV